MVDGNHRFRGGEDPVLAQGYDYRPLRIEDDAFISAKCTVIADVGALTGGGQRRRDPSGAAVLRGGQRPRPGARLLRPAGLRAPRARAAGGRRRLSGHRQRGLHGGMEGDVGMRLRGAPPARPKRRAQLRVARHALHRRRQVPRAPRGRRAGSSRRRAGTPPTRPVPSPPRAARRPSPRAGRGPTAPPRPPGTPPRRARRRCRAAPAGRAARRSGLGLRGRLASQAAQARELAGVAVAHRR